MQLERAAARPGRTGTSHDSPRGSRPGTTEMLCTTPMAEPPPVLACFACVLCVLTAMMLQALGCGFTASPAMLRGHTGQLTCWLQVPLAQPASPMPVGLWFEGRQCVRWAQGWSGVWKSGPLGLASCLQASVQCRRVAAEASVCEYINTVACAHKSAKRCCTM